MKDFEKEETMKYLNMSEEEFLEEYIHHVSAYKLWRVFTFSSILIMMIILILLAVPLIIKIWKAESLENFLWIYATIVLIVGCTNFVFIKIILIQYHDFIKKKIFCEEIKRIRITRRVIDTYE